MTYQTLFLNAAIVAGLVILSRQASKEIQLICGVVLLLLGLLLSRFI